MVGLRCAAIVVALTGIGGAVMAGGWVGGEEACLHCKEAAAAARDARGSVRYEAGTGRDLRNYAPDRLVDFRHMLLHIDIPDMNVRRLSAESTLTFIPIGRPLHVLTLDAEQLDIASVEGRETQRRMAHDVSWTYDDHELSIRFEPPIAPGGECELKIAYDVVDPVEGLFWTPESDAWPGRAAQIHTQGQPETNRYWFPCHDFPNERMTTELIVTVPDGYLVSSNGHLVDEQSAGNGRTTWHWLQDSDHVSYLVSLVVGKFDVVDVASKGASLPLPVYAPEGLGGLVKATYGNTERMIEVYEDRFGHPYPWDRYAQLCVWNFGAGGMENTGATTMYDTAILDSKALLDDDLDGLISHELAHQWFGDLITCNTWAHIWLNEGWATYGTRLWYEARDGYDDGYLWSMYGSLRGVAASDQIEPDDGSWRAPMVSPVYEHPWEVFRRKSNPYPKGASILHMLRMKLGDELFFEGVHQYVNRYAHSTADTDDFRKTLEEVSGLSLEAFFEQWCFRPGTPDVQVKAKWSEEDGELSLTIEQCQRIDDALPAFAFDLPVIVLPGEKWDSNDPVQLTIPVDSRRHERAIPLPGEPGGIIVDPQLSVLMNLDVDAKREWLIRAAEDGPTLPSRSDALVMLGKNPNPKAIEFLTTVVLDESRHHMERSTAAESLGRLRADEALVTLAKDGVDDARVRLAVTRALGAAGGDEARTELLLLGGDAKESYACRAAALEELGKLGSTEDDEALQILLEGLDAESQHEAIRAGALRGLSSLGNPQGLYAAAEYCEPGWYSRLRPVAIETIAALSEHDDDFAFETLEPLLWDDELRTRRAAGAALVDLEDERGLEALARLASSSREPQLKRQAEEWRDALAAAIDQDGSIKGAQREIQRLKRELERLEAEMDKR